MPLLRRACRGTLVFSTAMSRSAKLRLVILPLVCAALLFGRVAGAHLHMCLDGQEPSASVHHENDAGAHHENDGEEAGTHSDVDLSLIGELLIKAGKTGFDLPVAVLSGLLILILLPPALRLAVEKRAVPVHRPSLFPLRPPLRGPPLASH